MSKNQTAQSIVKTISIEEVNRKPLQRMITNQLKVSGVSQLRKQELVDIAKELGVEAVEIIKSENDKGVEIMSYQPVFKQVEVNREGKKVKTTKEAFAVLAAKSDTVVADVSKVMAKGVKLIDICKTPEKYLELSHVSVMKKFASEYNPYYVTVPTREMALVWVSDLASAVMEDINGNKEVVIKPRLELRAQNHLIDALCKRYVFITRNEVTGEIEVLDKHKAKDLSEQGVKVDRVRDMRYIVSMDYNLPILQGENQLTREQKFLQTRAIINGVFFEFNGVMLNAEYFMASASERRTVMGTHIVGLDAVEALHTLGMDFRQFAKYDGVKYTLDMIKAPTRFGLASTSSVPSSLIKIGNQIEEYENGEYAIVGGTHTMKIVDDIYSYVRTGKYMAFDAAQDKFIVLDASEVPFKRNVTDGLIFADASVQFALNAEFGKLISAEQVRITPATKGLVVFVPGLKDMVGHDLLAFESATKGNYKTLLRTNPDFNIEFRIAIFGKNAKDDKKKVNIPYQMIQTMFDQSHVDALKAKLDVEIEEAFRVYDSPEKLSEYLGTKTIELYEGVSEDELTDEQREQIDNTLVSLFTNFFYTGEFIMEDPYFKKRLLDIIENMIKAWTRGSLPIEGHYRFMVTDVYAVMEAYRMGSYAKKYGYESKFIDDNGDVIVPPHVGLAAGHVVMVDDQDKEFVTEQDVIFNRNPKISTKETAKARGTVTREYVEARKKYSFAFNNLVFFSCHDFNVVKQGGADFDGDKCHATTDPVVVDAYKDLPALLDLTYIDGEFVEGCPWQPKTKAEFDFFGSKYRSDVIVNGMPYNDEFKVMFTDEDYNLDFARKMHELSKVFVLRSLEPNQIGQLTNYATQILSAISRLQWSLVNGVDVDSKPLTDQMRKLYEDEIAMMDVMVDKLRLAQGWEIDRPKHGGAFWQYFNLKFVEDVDYFPTFATYTYVSPKGQEITRYAPLEWHKSARSAKSLELKDGLVFPSLMQQLRSHVLFMFTAKVKAHFNQLNPSSDSNNLIYRFAPVANVNDHGMVEAVLKMITPIFKEYGQAQVEIMNVRSRFEEQRELMNFTGKHEAEVYNRRMKHEINRLMDKAVRTAQAKVKALPFDEASIAYIAYAKKYRDYRPEKAASPASGLSFPWIVCRDGMLELVARVSGKSTQHVRLEKVEPAPVKIRFRSFEMSAEKVALKFKSATQAAVWYHVDEMTGNYLPFVYVGKERIGILVEESAYYFTGSEKFAFQFENFELSSTGKSASAILNNIERF
ncbi:hypothetical protein P9D81_19990 [Bacillus haynesii]|nr:hypothetical protein [Bacillus haynesii]MEC1657132.1 hypothetical protein [Bacillus haynesii]